MKKKITFKQENNNFYILVNNLFLKIEDNLNLYDNAIDFDYQIQDYVMTITFKNKSVIIINKQESLKQIWLATKKMGIILIIKKMSGSVSVVIKIFGRYLKMRVLFNQTKF